MAAPVCCLLFVCETFGVIWGWILHTRCVRGLLRPSSDTGQPGNITSAAVRAPGQLRLFRQGERRAWERRACVPTCCVVCLLESEGVEESSRRQWCRDVPSATRKPWFSPLECGWGVESERDACVRWLARAGASPPRFQYSLALTPCLLPRCSLFFFVKSCYFSCLQYVLGVYFSSAFFVRRLLLVSVLCVMLGYDAVVF